MSPAKAQSSDPAAEKSCYQGGPVFPTRRKPSAFAEALLAELRKADAQAAAAS